MIGTPNHESHGFKNTKFYNDFCRWYCYDPEAKSHYDPKEGIHVWCIYYQSKQERVEPVVWGALATDENQLLLAVPTVHAVNPRKWLITLPSVHYV